MLNSQAVNKCCVSGKVFGVQQMVFDKYKTLVFYLLTSVATAGIQMVFANLSCYMG